MPVPLDKASLLSAIATGYQQLNAELVDIPEEWTFAPTLEGHAQNTTMSVHNLVAYLVGWGQLVLKWHHLKEKGLPVDFPETGYKWNELGKLAQKFYHDYSSLSFTELLFQLELTTQSIQELVAHQSEEALYHSPWYNKHTLGKMIQLNTASPFKNARARIRKWKKNQGQIIQRKI